MSLEADRPLEDAIAAAGTVPLPPYIHEPLADPERYQTIFAQPVGSAAAPTAGLHFTTAGRRAACEPRSIGVVEIELQIGLDTFRPISTATIEEHQIHSENLDGSCGGRHRHQRAERERRCRRYDRGPGVGKPGRRRRPDRHLAAPTPASTSPPGTGSSSSTDWSPISICRRRR